MAIRARQLITSKGSPENYFLHFILGRISVAMETSNDPKEFQNNSIKQSLEITIPLR